MDLRKLALSLSLCVILCGGLAALPTVTFSKTAAASIKQVEPQPIEPKWVIGNYVDSTGQVYPDSAESVGFTTQKPEKGTLVLEIKKSKYQDSLWENIRRRGSKSLPTYLFAEPYRIDGRTDRAEKAYWWPPSVDFMAGNSPDNFWIRTVTYIDKINAAHTYYLGMEGASDRESFDIKGRFYPDVNLTFMTKEERDLAGRS